MKDANFYGYNLLSTQAQNIKGRLIVVEGPDGVGRSTQIALLREWLESQGYAVATSGLKRGMLAGKGLKDAMEGHTLGDRTMCLLYATDLADRLEREVLPMLRAGFIMLTDRYIYSIMARTIVRGVDPVWVRNLFRFAPVPDLILYLHADVESLTPRVLSARGFDYWESGKDFLKMPGYYNSFIEYQRLISAQFDAFSQEYAFTHVDANRSMVEVYQDLQSAIGAAIADMKPEQFMSGSDRQSG